MTEYLNENADLQLWTQQLSVSSLRHNRTKRFEIAPDAAILAAISEELGLIRLNKLRFVGEINAVGRSDWQLKASLGATVQQACIVTLETVTTRIDATVARLYVADAPEFEAGSEHEMPEDETIETLGKYIDLGEVMVEALGLNLPLYPRVAGAEADNSVFAEPGITPMSDDEARPFAGLGALRDKLADDDK